ncbi:hypothetical protein TNCT_514921 [Trichonephila clavata]|uniref:Uncharacterized protein n=1 Tax=Trichonephila clavata TaxID=2740835 RepID=A0A8X6HVM5_TRICU|nr:hypothetical protein TNCT_514921 [Trichonephila clavata]
MSTFQKVSFLLNVAIFSIGPREVGVETKPVACWKKEFWELFHERQQGNPLVAKQEVGSSVENISSSDSNLCTNKKSFLSYNLFLQSGFTKYNVNNQP